MIKTIKCLLLAAVCFFAGSMAAYRLTLSREVVRIRVIAASDSDRDQGLKRKVRDAVLSDLEDVPREALEEQLPELQTVAERALETHGASVPVRITLGREPYRRTPEDAPDLPSGTYETLCLTIGAGEGHNWWCVMFPPLCIPLASEPLDGRLPEDFSGKRVEIKFAIYEFFRSFFE